MLDKALVHLRFAWSGFWMRRAGLSGPGRLATRLAGWFAPPYKGRCYLATISPRGYVSPAARIHHRALRLGRHVFIGDRVIIYQTRSGSVELGDGVHLYADIVVETGESGSVVIGEETHVQPGCRLAAYRGSIRIGRGVEIAPNCGFYPYDHGTALGGPIRAQPLRTCGGIVVGDQAWLGFGVVVLDGVRIGDGAVVGAGSVVTHDIPDNAVAVGSPARVVRMREAPEPLLSAARSATS